MKKLLSRITAATLAAGMLVTEASASLVVPESTDPGTIAGSGMWLVQLYNEGDPDGDKPATDYGIDYSAVAGARFTIELDLDNPDLEENAFSLFEGNIGGGIVLSCCGGDIIQYEDDGETVTEIYSTYNWPSHNWWGIEFVNAEGETVDTNPNTMDDDLTNDNKLSTVKTGDYTYTITADFVNPLSCETDEWEINEIAVMQLAFQEWGNDTIPVEITCCEILDAEGNVLVWFDGQGNPSLENIAENTDSGSSGSDDDSSIDNPPIGGDDSTDDAREAIEVSGTTTTTLNDNGNVEGTMYQIHTTTVDGTYELQPDDVVEVTVAPTDSTVDTSAWVIAYNCFTSEWGGWCAVTSQAGELELSATVQDMMDVIDVTDIADFGGFMFQVWNTEADIEIDWTLTITPDNSASGDSGDDDSSDSETLYNAYMFIQTGAYSFRNKWYDESYGKDSVYFYDVIVWGEDSETYPDYAEYYNSDLSAYVMPASFTDAIISGDGSYQVSIADFDWAIDSSEAFNMLGISTDIPYSEDVSITDIILSIDGEIVEEYAEGYVTDDEGYICLTLACIWDAELESYQGTYPAESLEIEFSINGLDSSAGDSDEPVEPNEPEEPEHDGWLKFYMQNKGGDWAWFDVEEYIIHFDEEDTADTFELGWSDIQSAITNESGESLLLAPVEEWESYPAFGIEIGSQYIKEVGDKGRVSAKIEDITITLTDGTSFMIPDRLLAGDLLGVETDWGIGGYNAYIDLKETIMSTLEIEDYEYFDLIKTVDNVSATVIVSEFVPLSEDDADADEDSSDNFYTADTVEITDIKVADNEVTFSWTEAVNADSYNIYLVDGDTRTFVAKTTELTYTYVGEYCTEYTFAVCGCAGEREGSFAEFTVSTSHEYEEEYTTDREPTCSIAGVKSIHCKHCDARTNITEIETIDHDYSSVVVAPTYEREGYTLHMCAYCNDSYKTDATEMLALPAMTGVAVASRDAGSITFQWDEYLGLDVDGTMLGYVIEEMADGEVRAGEDIDDITITQWKYTGLRSSTEYTIQIRAYGVDSAGKPIYTKGVILENVATLPASMTGFAVTGRGSDNLTLSWNKNTTADGYVVQIQENNSWKNIAVIKSADTTSHVVTGLEPNSFYRFRMVAYKSYGTSKLYSKYTGAIPGYTAPAMVTGLTVSASTDTTMTVTWDENAYADGFILDIYKDGKWQQAADVTSAETSVVIEDLTASTLYKFRIKSYASNGSLLINSTYSASVSGTTKPAAMSDVKVSASTSTSLTVSWNKNASATGYILQMYTDGAWKNIVNIKDINTTSYVISGLSAGTSYKIRMVAYNNSTGSTLYGKYTGAITGTTSPAAVTNLRMTNRGTDFISVAWDKNANATGYMVYIYDGTSWKLVKTLTSASSVSHKITGLESGKTYKVNVKAYKTSGTQKLIADASMITATTL